MGCHHVLFRLEEHLPMGKLHKLDVRLKQSPLDNRHCREEAIGRPTASNVVGGHPLPLICRCLESTAGLTWAYEIVCRKCDIERLHIDGGIDGCAVNSVSRLRLTEACVLDEKPTQNPTVPPVCAAVAGANHLVR